MGDGSFSNDISTKANIVMPGTSGTGVAFGERGTGQFGWRDITGQVSVRGVGANDPDWTQISSTAFYAYKFALNDQCWFVYHVPHDILPNSDIYFHTHWLSDGTNTAAVKWEFVYSYAKGFDQAAFDLAANNTETATATPSGTQYQHNVTETNGITISGLSEPDGLVLVRIRRITNGGTDNTDGIFLLTADIHYQSTNIGTPGKAPGFYNT